MFKFGSGASARRKRGVAIGACTALIVTGLVGGQALAAHPEVSLPDSNFEIDTDANLIVDDTGNLDWKTVDQLFKDDVASGQTDNSFGEGSKEDDAVPSVVAGRIPDNKSDLKSFGGYLETTPAGEEFLNIYWTRVQAPTGTTNMDFEFNQSSTVSANGVTPVRTAGDLLIQYDLSQGGTNPQLFLSRWVATGNKSLCEAANATPCWGDKTNLTLAGDATGSINTTAIADPNLDQPQIGALDPRTFGEAQIDWDDIVGSGDEECVSFGSAYLKSRSSDSFTAALKDFIAPLSLNLSNCGGAIIRKQTNPDEAANSTLFDYTSNIATDTTPPQTNVTAFQLADDGVKTIAGVLPGTYTVTETAPSAASGYTFGSIDCSASTGFGVNDAEITVNGATITFTIDDSADQLDCTYTNVAQADLHIVKTTDRATTQSFDFVATPTPPLSNFSLLKDGQKDFLNIAPGTYNVAETVPANWDLQSATCSNGNPVTAIVLTAGSDVTCTFHNVVERGALIIHKDAKHAQATNAEKTIDLVGVTFTVTDENGAGTADDVIVGSDATGTGGILCIANIPVSALDGTYTIKETVPAGYRAETETQPYTVVGGTTCAGATQAVIAEFNNIPLTNITVTVDSQIPGGTASTIECTPIETDPDEADAVTDTNGDGSLTLSDLEPGTYTCEIVVDP